MGEVLHGSLLQLLFKHCDFLNIDISLSSVATCLRWDGIFKYELVANLPVSLPVKEFWKSINTWGSYGQEFGVLFFLRHCIFIRHQVRNIRHNTAARNVVSASHSHTWSVLLSINVTLPETERHQLEVRSSFQNHWKIPKFPAIHMHADFVNWQNNKISQISKIKPCLENVARFVLKNDILLNLGLAAWI